MFGLEEIKKMNEKAVEDFLQERNSVANRLLDGYELGQVI